MWHWLLAYWPWWVAFGWLVGYELWAVSTHHTTLSRFVWRASAAYPPLRWIAWAVIGVLLAHFWGGLWAPSGVVVPFLPRPARSPADDPSLIGTEVHSCFCVACDHAWVAPRPAGRCPACHAAAVGSIPLEDGAEAAV